MNVAGKKSIVGSLPLHWLMLLGLLMVGLVCSTSALGQSKPPVSNQTTLTATFPERDMECPAKHVVAMTVDSVGRLWVGTEDKGLYQYTPGAVGTKGKWLQFTTKDGLGDDSVYALACDKYGRIWAGHLNHGVSVYNGEQWQNYSALPGLPRDGVPANKETMPSLAGPMGERVFALATSPVDGDVWIGTSFGLTRYSVTDDAWFTYTRADGLPSDQIGALAFDKAGTLYVGTQCDGLAIAKRQDNYKTWRTVSCAQAFEEQPPLTPAGKGLPSNLINDLLVTREGKLFVATTTGLAWSQDAGQTFEFVRGKNWDEKVKGLYGGPPKGWQAPARNASFFELGEDYITCLAEAGDGGLWIGYRQKGYQYINLKTSIQYRSETDPALNRVDGYVAKILVPSIDQTVFARYGSTLNIIDQTPEVALKFTPVPATNNSTTGSPTSTLPATARLLRYSELGALRDNLYKLASKAPPAQAQRAVVMPDDWRTQGSWIGRRGYSLAVLCAMRAPYDYTAWFDSDSKTMLTAYMGPNRTTKDDSLRYWIHHINTPNPRSLELPIDELKRSGNISSGLRRQSEWDDHAEAMPMNLDGPHVYAVIHVPEGQYVLSLYFMNKDGEQGNNRFRDYVVKIKSLSNGVNFGDIWQPSSELVAASPHLATLAKSRVNQFRGGVYKQFMLQGGSDYVIEINKNYSFNTIISSVFLDPVVSSHSMGRKMISLGEDDKYTQFMASSPNSHSSAGSASGRILPELAVMPNRINAESVSVMYNYRYNVLRKFHEICRNGADDLVLSSNVMVQRQVGLFAIADAGVFRTSITPGRYKKYLAIVEGNILQSKKEIGSNEN